MTTVLHHEIVFYFTFVWPLLFLFSLLIAPSHVKNMKAVIILFLTGPLGTLYCLWKPFIYPAIQHFQSFPDSSNPPAEDAAQKNEPRPQSGREARQGRHSKSLPVLLTITWVFLFATGLMVFFHKGWTANYYLLVKWHSYIGYLSFALFALFLFRHMVRHADRLTGVLMMWALFFMFFLIFTLNTINKGYLLSFPFIFLIALAFRSTQKRLTEPVAEEKTRAGFGLFFIIVMSYYTGMYLAEPVNSNLTNSMALYILYIHGTMAAMLIPLFLSFIQIHRSLPLPKWFTTARKVCIPGYIFLILFLYPWAHHKWSGDRIEWRPVKTTHSTEPSLEPVVNQASFVPRNYHWTLNEYSVCASYRCHPSLVDQWRYSSHRFSGSNIFFQKVVEKLAKKHGRETTRFCQNCHDPAGAFHPDQGDYNKPSRWERNEGISCKVCHSVQYVKPLSGNGAYTIRHEIPYPVDLTAPDWRKKWQGYIRWDLRLHFKNYSNPPLYQSPDYCVACHRLSVKNSSGQKVVIHDIYESWQNSDYAKKGIKCRECHMDEFVRNDRGIYYPDHRFPGLNQALSYMVDRPDIPDEKLKEFEKFTVDWIRGRLPMRARVKRGNILRMSVSVIKTSKTSVFAVKVKTANARVGHQFPAGTQDLNEVWLELQVQDAKKNVIYHSGFLNPDFTLDPNARRLGAVLVDKTGQPISFHNVWETEKILSKREIDPGKSVVDMFFVSVPEDAVFPLKVRTAWKYRRARQQFVDWVFEQEPANLKKITFPVTEIISGVKMIGEGKEPLEMTQITPDGEL